MRIGSESDVSLIITDSKQLIIDSISDFEQRNFTKFAILLGWSKGVIRQLQKMIGRKAFAERTVYSWMNKINIGATDLSEHRGGDRNDPNLRYERELQIREAINESRRWIVRSLVLLLEIFSTVSAPDPCGKQQNLRDYKKHPDLLERAFSVDETWVFFPWSQIGTSPEFTCIEMRNFRKYPMKINALQSEC